MKMTDALLVAVLLLTFTAISNADGTRPNGDLAIAPSEQETVFIGETPKGRTSTIALEVLNPSETTKTSMVGTILNPHFKFAGARYPGEGGTCDTELTPHTTCTIVLEFQPKSQGQKRAVVRMNYWSGPRPETSFRVLEGLAR